MARRKRPWFRNRKVALYGGYTCLTLGSLMLWDAYENRGRSRPFASKFVPV